MGQQFFLDDLITVVSSKTDLECCSPVLSLKLSDGERAQYLDELDPSVGFQAMVRLGEVNMGSSDCSQRNGW